MLYFEQIRPQEHKILLTEPPQNPMKNREKLIQTMFEKYEFGALNISIQALLTLSAQVSIIHVTFSFLILSQKGLLSGVVVDTGDGVTHVVPIYESFVPQHLIRRLDVAGRHVTQVL